MCSSGMKFLTGNIAEVQLVSYLLESKLVKTKMNQLNHVI